MSSPSAFHLRNPVESKQTLQRFQLFPQLWKNGPEIILNETTLRKRLAILSTSFIEVFRESYGWRLPLVLAFHGTRVGVLGGV